MDTAYVREIPEILVEIRILEPETIRMTHGMSGKGLFHVVQMLVWCRGISHQKCLNNSGLGFVFWTIGLDASKYGYLHSPTTKGKRAKELPPLDVC